MKLTKEEAKKMSILDVAYSLNMNMVKTARNEYLWVDHDSLKINTDKNSFFWYSRGFGGDTIKLVETVKNVSYSEAMNFLETGEFKKAEIKEVKKEPFVYHLGNYEKDFSDGRSYLKDVRGLSDDTIDFFLNKNMLSLVHRKTKDGYEEDVIVFKFLDKKGEIVGGSLQGITPNKERYAGKGYLKQLMYNSQYNSGFNVDIGDKVEKLIFFEAPIDMMSYYELNKSNLANARLVAMEGLKESTLSRYFIEYALKDTGQEINISKSLNYLEYMLEKTDYFDKEENQKIITVAVDNDSAGKKFIDKLKEKGMKFQEDLPPNKYQSEKIDWNDILKEEKNMKGNNSLENLTREEINNYLENKPEAKWYIEFNEQNSFINKDYSSLEKPLTKDDLDDLRILDYNFYNLKQEAGENWNEFVYSKFYLEKRLEGDLIERYKIYIGDGDKENFEDFKYIYSDMGEGFEDINLLLEKKGIKKDLENTRQNKNVEGTIEDFTENQKAAPLPEEIISRPLNDVSPQQTEPQRLLHFTIKNPNLSINKRNYHRISQKELKKLNRYSLQIQQVANWYLKNLSDRKLHYLYKDSEGINNVTLEFRKEHFMHLTGIQPLKDGQTAEKTLLDFANGNGEFDNIMISNGTSAFQKLQVLPEFESILESSTVYFDDLSSIEKLNKFDLSKGLNAEDKDLLLLLKQEEANLVPASLMKVKGNLSLELDKVDEKTILGVYREDKGKIEQISINEDYIKDGGKELINIVKDYVENSKTDINIIEEKNKQEELEKAKSEIKKEFFNESLGKKEKNSKDIKLENNNKTIDEYIKNRDIEGLNKLLKDGIKEFTNSENFKNYLKVMSKFHRYSRRNISLIYNQNKNATLVAGYNDWKNKFGRQVKKGEKAISIISPRVIKQKDKEGNPILDENGLEKKSISFHKVSVFDVSQTEGKELPKYIQEIDKEVDGYKNLYIAVKEYAKEKNVKIEFADLSDGARGMYNPKTDLITLQKQMSQGQTMKTLFHELAHSQLHKNIIAPFGSREYAKGELEAESIAYIVSNHYGLDTSSYSFGYLHSYMEDISDIDNLLETIHNKSKELIEKIDINLEKIKNKEIKKDPLQEKIERFKQQEERKMSEKKEVVEAEKKYQNNLKI